MEEGVKLVLERNHIPIQLDKKDVCAGIRRVVYLRQVHWAHSD